MAGLNVPPPMDIPPSQNIVEISIIDTTTYMTGFPASDFVEPDIAGFDIITCHSLAYIIKHPHSGTKYDTMVFDLGVRQDWGNLPATFVAEVKASGGSITVKKDVATILQENGQNLEDVGAIIWSHWHFDHVGNPRTFPNTTDLIVGPGFKSNFIPSYPTIPSSQLDERAWEDRDMHEIDFSGPKGLKIGDFEAYDFYGDGSFFLLHSPGHAIGHMSALARTTADPPTFILLGGDIAHHCGEFRPSRYIPLPDIITPSPISHRAGGCPGRLFQAVHPKRSRDEPFFDPVMEGGWHHVGLQAKESIDKLIVADAYDNIFPVMAHDMSILGIVDFYPKTANDWMAKGWKRESHWSFLNSFTPVDGNASWPSSNAPTSVKEHRKDSAVSGPTLP